MTVRKRMAQTFDGRLANVNRFTDTSALNVRDPLAPLRRERFVPLDFSNSLEYDCSP